MEKEFHSNSKIIINGETKQLESFSEEERATRWGVFAERISNCISEYTNQHPEKYKEVKKWLMYAPEAELLYEESSKTPPAL